MLDFPTFYKKKFGDLAAFARNGGMSPHDSDDLAQNVLIDFWKRLDNGLIDENKGIDSFLFQRMKWRIIDSSIRNKRNAKKFSQIGENNDLDELEEQGHKNAAAFQWEIVKRAVKSIKNKIVPRHYNFFVERVINGKETSEIAKKYNVNASSVYLCKHRVMQKVIDAAKQILKDEL